MFLIDGKQTASGVFYYLLNGKTCSVGRKDADILILKDKSISRKHAILKADNDNLIVTDCGATYCTYIDSVKLEPNVPQIAKDGSLIKLGGLQTTLRVTYIRPVLVCTSGFTVSKTDVSQQIDYIGGKLSQTWSKECTHLTVEKCKLTPKVLCALIENQPIVTNSFWHAYASAVKWNKPLPLEAKYEPPLGETSLNSNISLAYKPNRKTLFKNKVFVFDDVTMLQEMTDLLRLASGEVLRFNDLNLTKEEVLESHKEYLFMQNISVTQTNAEFDEYVRYLKEHNRYSIPVGDIGLAILFDSCEKHANSRYDKRAIIKKTNATPSQRVAKKKKKELVPETQNIDVPSETPKREPITDDVIECTPAIEGSQIISCNNNGDKFVSPRPLTVVTTTASNEKKRKEHSMEARENAFKKVKVEAETSVAGALPEMEETSMNQQSLRNPFTATRTRRIKQETQSENVGNKRAIDESGTSIFNSRKKRCSEIAKTGEKFVNPFARSFQSSHEVQRSPNVALAKSISHGTPIVVSDQKLNATKLSADYCEKFSWIEATTELPRVERKYDNEVKEYVDSFKSIQWTIITMSKEMLPSNAANDSGIEIVKERQVNYKKFKKVLPKCPQSYIIRTENERNGD